MYFCVFMMMRRMLLPGERGGAKKFRIGWSPGLRHWSSLHGFWFKVSSTTTATCIYKHL